MFRKRLSIKTPGGFSFWRTVLSHGWCVLPPFYADKDRRILRRVLKTTHQPVMVSMREGTERRIEVAVESDFVLTRDDDQSIRSQVKVMLRLEESLERFYQTLSIRAGNGDFSWIARVKAGRLLRCPTLFEDIVKMICTTNCSWRATERMVDNLVTKIGSQQNSKVADFPSAEQLASTTEAFLIDEIRTGYRSAYLLELAERVAGGKLKLDLWRNLEAGELYTQLLSVKGIGPYVAGNLLRLLGHYEHLALDSWCRSRFSELYHQGKKVSDKKIARHYAKHGRWRGLVMWLDLTRDWFEEEEKRPF